jgi:creatinine amidohydrolase/Fe(II)-dependent formamide hydrolase-like protein
MDKAKFVPGVSDDPILGTKEKGEKILEAGAKALAEYVRAMAARPGKKVVGIKKA